jgi:hypothetical protein
MSKGPWKRCPYTGMSMALMCRAKEGFLDWEGFFDYTPLPDCNLFDVRSFAAAAGFETKRHFVDYVLSCEGTPFHFYRLSITDDEGHQLFDVFATHVNSAQVGGQFWRQMQAEHARRRATPGQ